MLQRGCLKESNEKNVRRRKKKKGLVLNVGLTTMFYKSLYPNTSNRNDKYTSNFLEKKISFKAYI